MDFEPKKILYHGSPKKFERFNKEGLGFENGYMAVTAGFYFTDDLEQALGYAGEDGYIYQIELKQDLAYKANKDREFLNAETRERIICIDSGNRVSIDLHFNLSVRDIKAIIKSRDDWKDKIIDFDDIDVNDKFQLNNLLSKIAHNYKKFYFTKDENFIQGINVLGNDWLNRNEDDLLLFNQVLSQKLNLSCIAKEIVKPKYSKDGLLEEKGVFHYVFLDPEKIPELTIKKAKDFKKENQNNLEEKIKDAIKPNNKKETVKNKL